MKKKISIAVVVIAVIVGIYFVFAPTPVGRNSTPSPDEIQKNLRQTGPGEADMEEAEATEPTGVEMESRVERMRAEYALLEEAREGLRDRINELKARLYGVKLPAERANELNHDMMEAFVLLKNPPMLGAFRDVDGIREEIGKIEQANKRLGKVDSAIDEIKGGEQ